MLIDNSCFLCFAGSSHEISSLVFSEHSNNKKIRLLCTRHFKVRTNHILPIDLNGKPFITMYYNATALDKVFVQQENSDVFLISPQESILWFLIRTASVRCFNEYPQRIFTGFCLGDLK